MTCQHAAIRIERGPTRNPMRVDYVREVCLRCEETRLRRVVSETNGKAAP